MKKTLCFVLAMLLILSLSACVKINLPSISQTDSDSVTSLSNGSSSAQSSAGSSAQLSASSSAQPAPLTIETKQWTEEDSYVKINVEYPVISGMKDITLQSELNGMLLNKLTTVAQQLKDDAVDAYGYENFAKFTLDSQVSIRLNDGVRLSITVAFQDYTGGAHGDNGTLYINALNTSPGKDLGILDIFTDSAQGKTRINTEITAQIAGDTDYTFTTIEDDQGFYMGPAGLTIVFPAYSIGYGAMGEPSFEIPYATLSDILLPEITG